jgi:hypothetical protein
MNNLTWTALTAAADIPYGYTSGYLVSGDATIDNNGNIVTGPKTIKIYLNAAGDEMVIDASAFGVFGLNKIVLEKSNR